MGNLRVEALHLKCRKLGHHFTTMSVFPSHCCWAALDCKLWCQKQQISLADSCVTCRCRVWGYWRIGMHKYDWRRVREGMGVWFQNRVAAMLPSNWTSVAPWGDCCGSMNICGTVEGERRDVALQHADRHRLGERGKKSDCDWRRKTNEGVWTNPAFASSGRCVENLLKMDPKPSHNLQNHRANYRV